MSTITFLRQRLTLCDSGEKLSPFLHVFMFLTLAFSLAFLFAGNSMALQASVLYQGTVGVGTIFDNLWGAVGLAVCVLNLLAFLIRGKIGIKLMPLCIFGGSFLWIWAGIIYLSGGFWFQFLVAVLPNLYFWYWYYRQWLRRRDGAFKAFV